MIRVSIVLTILLTLSASPSFAEPAKQVEIVHFDNAVAIEPFIEAARAQLPGYSIKVTDLAGPPRNKTDTVLVHIVAGQRALRAILESSPSAPVLSIFVPRQSYREATETLSTSQRKRVSAIFADPDPLLQLGLVQRMFSRPIGVTVMLSPQLEFMGEKLRESGARKGLDVVVERVSETSDVFRAIARMRTPVLLAIPDPVVINGDTLQNVLLATYRREIAVVGYTDRMVQAGSLATIYHSPAHIARAVAAWVQDFTRFDFVPSERYPAEFDVAVNKHIAHSLGLTDAADDESVTTLAQSLRKELSQTANSSDVGGL